jgi:predicted secreted hydrolase
MRCAILPILAVLILVPCVQSEPGPVWRDAAPGYEWSFPRDLSAHPEFKTEWWYVTGHLDPVESAAPLAFQLTFFRVGLDPAQSAERRSEWEARDLVMAHAAITDADADRHLFSEVVWRTTPFLGGFGAPGDSTLAWCRAPAGTDAAWRIDWRDGAYELSARDDRQGLRFELRCTPTRPPVLHGQGGFSPKNADGSAGSLYFSQPRMQVGGQVYRDGESVAVTGDAWLDRELFTSTLSPGQKGWDWIALNLDDGRDLMLYRLRGENPSGDFALGTLVEADGSTRSLPASSWSLRATSEWTSPVTAARYPVNWSLTIPSADISVVIEAVMPDQENVSARTGIHYWEGAVRVRSKAGDSGVTGKGFIELTGYGEGSRPPV